MKDQAIVVLDDNITPKGYAYLLVNQGYGTMVTVLYREYRREKEYFERIMIFFKDHIDMDIKNEKNSDALETSLYGTRRYIIINSMSARLEGFRTASGVSG